MDDTIIVAAAVEGGAAINTTKEFNIVLGATLAISLVFLFLSAIFGDPSCFSTWTKMAIPVSRSCLGTLHPSLRDLGDFGVALEVGPYEVLATENGGTQPTILWNIVALEEGGQHPMA